MRRGVKIGGTNIGGSSILMIFVLLCLTTFATLAMVSATASLRMAERMVHASDAYFAADNRAEEIFAEISRIAASPEAGIPLRLRDMELEGFGFFQAESGAAFISYTVPIDNSRSLNVELLLEGRRLSVVSWKMVAEYIPEAFEGGGQAIWDGR